MDTGTFNHKKSNSIQCDFAINNILFMGVAFLIACITFSVYLPSLQNGFVNWDDNQYVYENPNIRSLDFKLIKWSLTAAVGGLWHPVTVLSLAFDYALWGLNPWGYHLTNILFHAFNTFLVFIVAVKLVKYGSFKKDESGIKALLSGILTALLFGIHPLHVESVAWVSERKDVLSSFFFLSSILAYLRYSSIGGPKRPIFYAASFISFILALMSKPMAISLPIIFLIFDYYPLRRLTAANSVLREKIPFFAFSLLASLITIWVQRLGGALQTLEEYPFAERVLIAVRALVFYLAKMVLPSNLAPYYPHPVRIDLFTIEYMGSIILLTMITILCITQSLKGYRLFLAIWLYYIVMLIPVIGIVKVGDQSMADRYTYLPSFGPFFLVGLGITYLFRKLSKKHWQLAIIVLLIFMYSFLVIKTIRQIAIWGDNMSLWSYEIKLLPGKAAKAYLNRGNAFIDIGNYRQGLEDFNEAVRINPSYALAYYNRGRAYYDLRKYELAITNYSRAIELNPQYDEAYGNRGNVYYLLGNYRLAIMDYNKTIALNPNIAIPYYNLGLIYSKMGYKEKAIIYFKKAEKLGLDKKQIPE